jgi:hypothetical protein
MRIDGFDSYKSDVFQNIVSAFSSDHHDFLYELFRCFGLTLLKGGRLSGAAVVALQFLQG